MQGNSPHRLGKYVLKSLLGKGGMGAVYRAEDTRLSREVAIKILPRRLAEHPSAVERFLREARATARLDHPNVISVLDVDQQDGRPFLVMELIRGKSLQAILEAGPLPWRDASRVIADCCQGLTAAHAQGLIHRDLKPGNILRTDEGVAKLADFGLAKSLAGDETNHLTSTGHLLGTPHYMSPEQCQGEALDPRSDLYSLGATYFALLTGRPPFSQTQPLQLMFAHCSAPIPDPRALQPDIPQSCAAIVQRALAKQPSGRFGSAREMLQALQTALGSSPAGGTSAGHSLAQNTPSNPTQNWAPATAAAARNASMDQSVSPPPVQRRRGSLRAPLVVTGVSAAVIGLGLWIAAGGFAPVRSARVSSPVATATAGETATAAPPAVTLHYQGGLSSLASEVRAVDFSPNGDTLYVGSRDGSLHAWSLDSDAPPKLLNQQSGSIDAVATGRHWIASGGTEGTIWLTSPADPERRVRLARLSKPICALAQNSRGDRLAVGTEGSVELFALDSAGGHPKNILATQDGTGSIPAYMVYSVVFSADDSLLAATSWSRAVGIWEVSTGRLLHSRHDLGNEPISVAFLPGTARAVLGFKYQDGVHAWDYDQPTQPLRRIEAAGDRPVRTVVPLGASQVAIHGEWDGPIHLYDITRDRSGGTVQHSTRMSANALAISRDGRRLATGGGHGEPQDGGYLQAWTIERDPEEPVP